MVSSTWEGSQNINNVIIMDIIFKSTAFRPGRLSFVPVLLLVGGTARSSRFSSFYTKRRALLPKEVQVLLLQGGGAFRALALFFLKKFIYFFTPRSSL